MLHFEHNCSIKGLCEVEHAKKNGIPHYISDKPESQISRGREVWRASKCELKMLTKKRDKRRPCANSRRVNWMSELQSGRVAACDIDVTFLQRWGQNCSWATAIVCWQKILKQKYGDHTKVNAPWSKKKPGQKVGIWAQQKSSERRICKRGSMIVGECPSGYPKSSRSGRARN